MQRSRNVSLVYPWWLLTLVTILLLALTIAFSAHARAEGRPDPVAAGSPQSGGQMFYDNLTVADGEVYEGDVTVASGNVLVEDGGLIEGNLIVWSGNVEILAGGEVEGDVSALSGNAMIAGDVGGSVAAVSGNIELLETANVNGDVSVISGDIRRAAGAEVDGNVIKGSGFKMPKPFSGWRWGGDGPVQPVPPVMAAGASFWGWLGWTILRMVMAVIVTAVIVTLVCVLFNLRPDVVRPLAPLVRERAAYTFVVGLIVNLVLLVLTSALFFTFCLAILGLAPGLVLVALNLVGWTLASQVIGERLASYIQTPMQPIAKVAIGAIVATGAVMLLWALGGCFRPAGHLLWLLISSFGVGAAVVHWLKLDRRDPAGPQTGEPAPLDPMVDPTSAEPPVVTSEPPATATHHAPPIESSIESSSIESSLGSLPSHEPTPTQTSPLEPEADFTVIKGIGATFDQRLKAAGVRTFAQLAALTAEQVAKIIGWTPQRVVADDLLGQARWLASDRT